MRALSGSSFDFATLQGLPEDQSAEFKSTGAQRSGQHKLIGHKLIVDLYLVSVSVVSVAWLAGLAWAAIKVIGYALS
jgi:hypothetical protein